MKLRELRFPESIERVAPVDGAEPPIYVLNLATDPAPFADEDGYITFSTEGVGGASSVRCRVRYISEPTEIGGRLILPGVWVTRPE